MVAAFDGMVMGLACHCSRGSVVVMAACLGPDAGLGLARLSLTSEGLTTAEPPLIEPGSLLGVWAEGSDFDSRSEL